MLGFLFKRKQLPEVEFLLRVLDTKDLKELAVLYREARNVFESQPLMTAVSKRMREVIARNWQGSVE